LTDFTSTGGDVKTIQLQWRRKIKVWISTAGFQGNVEGQGLDVLLACFWPARTAARIDQITALRHE
jgi:hypothetical protein